jgi:single-stranded-DNA-specific exonuclease
MNRYARWVYADANRDIVQLLASELNISELLAGILSKRGISDPVSAEKFLEPRLEHLYDPLLMDGMVKAVERILHAIRTKEKVIVHGDYDADGITSTSMLVNFLASAGLPAEYYIPNRMNEGYGISAEGTEYIRASGASLVITADCGITAVDEIETLQNSGIDVVVTDHHECGNSLPNAVAIVNPCKPGDPYPFKELSGAGVVFKLLQALSNELRHHNALDYLDLAALGTVADVVPLLDENRIIVKYGIDAIKATENEGLRALLEVSGISGKQLESWHLAFILGPRINAAGRLSDASKAVRLFTCGNRDEAQVIAAEMEKQNLMRRSIEKEIFDEALDRINKGGLDAGKVIVVSGENWHRGVIGIVASKLVEHFGKPSVVISVEDGEATGSARSVEGFNIYDALKSCGDILVRFGGHEMAAGFTIISPGYIDCLRKALNDLPVIECLQDEFESGIYIDEFATAEDLCLERINELEKLKPFGTGNPKPVLGCRNMRILEKRCVGGGKHLKMTLDCGGRPVDAIGFNMEDDIGDDIKDLDAAFTMEIDSWSGTDRVQLKLVDLRMAVRAISKDEYYESLCKCLEYFSWAKVDLTIEENENKYTDTSLDNVVGFPGGERVLFLVNNFNDLAQVLDYVNKSPKFIKKSCKICYNKLDAEIRDHVVILVNPIPGRFTVNGFDAVVVYGSWLDNGYLKRVTDSIGDDCMITYRAGAGKFPGNDIVPDRRELAYLYKYLRDLTGLTGPLKLDSMSSCVREFSRVTGMESNIFKVRKSLEIFEELGLATVNTLDGQRIEVVLRETNGEKKDLMESLVFSRLQELKQRLEQADDFTGFQPMK